MPNFIHRFRLLFARIVQSLPFWEELNWMSRPVAIPFRIFAAWSLRKFPWLAKVEWALEVRSLANRPPLFIALSAALAAWRGAKITVFGHIGTDPAIYPLIAVVSSFNPYLALCCAAVFGLSDVAQKLLVDDIYGAPSRWSLDYWGAMTGYVVAYSALVLMALTPGILSRLLRKLFVYSFYKLATADGANESSHQPSLAEDLVAAGGALVGSYFVMQHGAPALEKPAFYFRPDADASCFQVEVGGLQNAASGNALIAAASTALTPTGADDGLWVDPTLAHTPAPISPSMPSVTPGNPILTDRSPYPGNFPSFTPVVSTTGGAPIDLLPYPQTGTEIHLNTPVDLGTGSGTNADSGGPVVSTETSPAAQAGSAGGPEFANGSQESGVPTGLKVGNDVLTASTLEYDMVDRSLGGINLASNEAEQFMAKSPEELATLGKEGAALAQEAEAPGLTWHMADVLTSEVGAVDAVSGGLSAGVAMASEAYDHTTQTTIGTAADVSGAGVMGLIVGANPATAAVDNAMNFLGDTGLVPGADKLSPSATLSTSVRATTTLAEGLMTGDTTGLNQFQDQSMEGKNGWVFQKAAQAGEFWQENGLGDGLEQGAEGAGTAIKNLWNNVFGGKGSKS